MGDERAHHQRVSEILGAALERDEGTRADFVRTACGGDEALTREVLDLLDEAERPGDFLDAEGSIVGVRAEVGSAPRLEDSAHTGLPEVPGYRVIRRLASGGMGVVYEAEQVSPRRRVAIKVLAGVGGNDDALRRFRFESEVLGRLRHPNIAQVHEAGTYSERGETRPFLAMEFVPDALPLTKYAAEAGLSVRARVRLFTEVCDAVRHGHQRGIIHRDLKPGNILVDGEGRAKVIDYGVARALTDATIVRGGDRTVAGGIVGTVRYMSPEQCGGDPDAVDARSDVYALGVVLYELLTGAMPYEVEKGSLAGVARTIESVEPRAPSSVDASLKGDLDAIVLCALEKDPERRYATAAALGADLARWLDNLPVEARPSSTLYQLRKLAARNRSAAVAVGIAALALVAGAGVSTAMAVRATRAAEAEREQVEALSSLNAYLAGVLTSVTPEATRSSEVTVREMLAGAIERIDEELGDRPLLAARVRHEIGSSYLSVGAAAEAAAVLETAFAAREELLGDDEETLATLVRLGDALIESGRSSEATPFFKRAIAMWGRLEASGRGTRRAGSLSVEAGAGLGIAAAHLGDVAEGERLLRAAIAEGEAVGIDTLQRLSLKNMLGRMRAGQGAYDEAIALLREVADERARVLGETHPSTLISENNYGSTLTDAGRYEEAAAALRDVVARREAVLGTEHPMTVSSVNNLAIALSRLGESEEAERLSRSVLDWRLSNLGAEHEDTIRAAMNLYTNLDRSGKPDEAERVLEAYVPLADTLPVTHPTRLFAASKFVLGAMRREDFAQAELAARRTLEALEAQPDGGGWEGARFRALLGAALAGMGDADARRTLEAAVEGLEAARGADHAWTRWAVARLEGLDGTGDGDGSGSGSGDRPRGASESDSADD